ncbi:MAG: hypothetical protein K5669_04945, partial [Lachnospiraceae bacterium]|nr:hypothetical protein [Lachnospiraceae bacterium]
MKKLVLFLITITALTFAGCAKTEIPEFSDEYLVGVDYGGATYGEYYECIGAMVIVCENREVLVKMPTPKAAYYRTGEEEVIATFTISEDQYATIDSIVNQKKLYKMVVKSDSSACDAPSYYLYLYDKDENILKAVGAYMPIS